MSGTVAVYEFGAGVVTNEPMTAEAFSGTVDTPKVHEGDVTVSITDATKLENATVNGNLIIKGTPTESFSMTNITVEGNLDLTGLWGNSKHGRYHSNRRNYTLNFIWVQHFCK